MPPSSFMAIAFTTVLLCLRKCPSRACYFFNLPFRWPAGPLETHDCNSVQVRCLTERCYQCPDEVMSSLSLVHQPRPGMNAWVFSGTMRRPLNMSYGGFQWSNIMRRRVDGKSLLRNTRKEQDSKHSTKFGDTRDSIWLFRGVFFHTAYSTKVDSNVRSIWKKRCFRSVVTAS